MYLFVKYFIEFRSFKIMKYMQLIETCYGSDRLAGKIKRTGMGQTTRFQQIFLSLVSTPFMDFPHIFVCGNLYRKEVKAYLNKNYFLKLV